MIEQMTEDINYRKGYDKGWADAQEYLAQKFNKKILKAQTESYDKGYKDGANKKDNQPCVCGFWNENKWNQYIIQKIAITEDFCTKN